MANIYDLSDTWNDGGTTFNAIKMNVTDTASDANSLLMDLQVGGSSKFSVDKIGVFHAGSASASNPHDLNIGGTGRFGFFQGTNYLLAYGYSSSATGTLAPIFSAFGNTRLVLTRDLELTWASGTSVVTDGDLKIVRDAANTLAQRNGTNAQTFNLYNTYTNATNYERGFMRWNSNVLEIGAEADGAGTARGIKLLSPIGTNLVLQGNVYFANAAGSTSWRLDGNLFPLTDSAVDLGSASAKVRKIYTDAVDGSVLTLDSLPTADPVNAGQLWNDSGTLKVSAG